MSYLKFDKALMINLEESLNREVLRTNRGGAYHCTTIVDCNTRKYHGLLVMPVPTLDNDNHVLLSSLDETVIQHGAEFNLGLHKYGGDNYSPKGHKYIRQFDCEEMPRTVYRVGGVVLAKEKVFTTFGNRFLIKYTLLDAHSPTMLRFKPFLAFRSVNMLTSENDNVNKNYTEIENGIKTCMYPGYPELHLQFSKPCGFVFQPDWYRGIEYTKEMECGFPYKEDLYVPGYFELPIEKDESIYFSAANEPICARDIEETYNLEVKSRTPRNSFFNSLKNSAQQFYFRPTENDAYLLAGYPWFKVRARDLFLALPGCTLSIDDIIRFEKIMGTAIPAIRNFIKDESLDAVIKDIDLPDVFLWAIWAIQQYKKTAGEAKCLEMYGNLVFDIIAFIESDEHPNLFIHDNGLLYSNGKSKAITWMNATVNGRPVAPRTGYIVEFNALWYNALKFAAELSSLKGDAQAAGQFDKKAALTANSFLETFMNGYGYLFDYVDGDYVDWSVRPNMLFAVAFDYSPLDRMQKRKVLDYVTKELLTPKGLRTLSPKSEGYLPYCIGTQYERDMAYHQGTAWPWLAGIYLESYLKIFGLSGLSFVERMLISFDEEMSLHCIGSISELFDGNPPFEGRGAISFAMNVAAILRVLKLLESYILVES
ncbi:MAG: amylo-alpha-1,6-glucosidase [Dysgonamonadaceae bacterium]|jgi:predicted glycogen debranching enzyme|nr:amylo-alpha-1,6-glucosidase [Dysgonamonadaceae bacterium]